MKFLIRTLVVLPVMWMLSGCDGYDFPNAPYPRVRTLPVSDISAEGITLTGKLIQRSHEPIIDHGFVWGNEPYVTLELNVDGAVHLGEALSLSEFKSEVPAAELKDRTDYARAFVKTETYTVYGDAVAFE